MPGVPHGEAFMTVKKTIDTIDTSTDFSLVLGGPLFQLLRRAHLTGGALELLRRRILLISLFAWLPLLLLSALEGQALGGKADVPFIMDVEVHVKFLVVVPLSVAPPGLFPIAMVIEAVEVVIVFPEPSCTVTVGGPEIALPVFTFPGWVVNTRTLAAPGLTVNAELSADVSTSPLVRVAVITTPLSALLYVTPAMVT